MFLRFSPPEQLHSYQGRQFGLRLLVAYNTSTHATTGFTPFYLMFGRQARIPADLMYGTAEPESLNCTEYAAKLQESLSKAYTVARKHVAGKQE